MEPKRKPKESQGSWMPGMWLHPLLTHRITDALAAGLPAIQASLPVSGNHFKYHLVAFRLFYDNAMPIERIIKLIVAEV